MKKLPCSSRSPSFARFAILLPMLAAAAGLTQEALTPVGNWPLSSTDIVVRSVAVQHPLAVLATDKAGVVVCDVSNPECPVRIGDYPLAGAVSDVVVVDGRALAATSAQGLLVLDLSDPTHPVRVGGVAGTVGGRMVLSGKSILLTQPGGLVAFDLTDPVNPVQQVVTVVLRGPTRDLAISGERLCVTRAATGPGTSAGIDVFDVSDLTQPAWLAGIDLASTPEAVDWMGSHVVVADETAGLTVVDFSDPGQPTVFTNNLGIGARDVTITGQLAVAVGGNLVLVDLSNPGQPVIVGKSPPGAIPQFVAVDGNRAFVGEVGGMKIVNLTDPAAPTIEGRVLTSGDLVAIATAWPYAYTVELESGLYVLDVTNRSRPVNVGQLFIRGSSVLAHDLAVDGQRLYLASASSGLHVIEVTNPTRPKRLGGLALRCRAVAARGSHVYLAESGGEFKVVSVADPANPTIVASAPTGDDPRVVALHGQYALVGDANAELRIFDVKEPSAPSLVATVESSTLALAMKGNQAIIGSARIPTLSVVDLTDPTAPVSSWQSPANYAVKAMATGGGLAFVVNGSGLKKYLDVYDFTTGDAPRHWQRMNWFGGKVDDLDFETRFLYSASGEGVGVHRLNPRLSVRPTGAGKLALTMPSLAGHRYFLEETKQLDTPAWSVTRELEGSEVEVTFDEPLPAIGSGFYRVREEPPNPGP